MWFLQLPQMLKIPLFCHLILDIIKLISDSISLLSCCEIFFVFAWRLLFYREPITLTSLSIVISLQFPHIVRFTDTVLSLEFKDGTAPLFKIFATPDTLPNAKIFVYLLLSIYNIPVIWAFCGNRKDIVCALSPVLPE